MGGRYHLDMKCISRCVNKYLMGMPHEVNVITGDQEGSLVKFLEAKVPLVPDQGLLKKLFIHEVR